jgi:TerB N-terminal domain/TerB-C domain
MAGLNFVGIVSAVAALARPSRTVFLSGGVGMGRRSGNTSQVFTAIIVLIVVIAAVPRQVWIGLALIAAGILVVRWIIKRPRPAPPPTDDRTLEQILAQSAARSRPPGKPQRPPAPAPAPPPPLWGVISRTMPKPSTPAPEPLPEFQARTASPATATPPTFALPPRPAELGPQQWITPGGSVQIAGATIAGGMIYVGTPPRGTDPDPSLIDPRLTVAKVGDFTVRQTDYWPSYGQISPTARRAYLMWLATGRRHPDCDAGFVFLFFYGLERRVLIDGFENVGAAEWAVLADEVRALLQVYGEKSPSFAGHAQSLLEWMALEEPGEQLYQMAVPALIRNYALPWPLKIALGQAARDRAPLPELWALAWLRFHPAIFLRTPAQRCADEFDQLFLLRYRERWGAGMVLPKNRTKLKATYRAASHALRGADRVRTIGDLPDVSVLSAPMTQLQELAQQCTDELDAYSRAVGKDEQLRGTPAGLPLLPYTLWPDEVKARLVALHTRSQGGPLILRFEELLQAIGLPSGSLSNDKTRTLVRTIAACGLGLEPDVLEGAKVPAASDPVVLFALQASIEDARDSANYALAMLTLQLAAAGAHADGDFSAAEEQHLREEIDRWAQLTIMQRGRLQAHLRWLTVSPVSLSVLKKKLAPTDSAFRERMGLLLATLAQVDGMVSPSEMKFLEKAYGVLGLDNQRLFSNVHAVSTGAGEPRSKSSDALRLDSQRIKALQEDTATVSALLADIFQQEPDLPPAPPPVAAQPEPEPEPEVIVGGMLGLDAAHATLARLLLSRRQWARTDLEDAAADLALMLDGALESINDAAYEAFDMPLAEGDDPLEINADIVEKLKS